MRLASTTTWNIDWKRSIQRNMSSVPMTYSITICYFIRSRSMHRLHNCNDSAFTRWKLSVTMIRGCCGRTNMLAVMIPGYTIFAAEQSVSSATDRTEFWPQCVDDALRGDFKET